MNRRTPNPDRLFTSLCTLAFCAAMTSWAWSADTTVGKGELVFLCPNAQRQAVTVECDGVAVPVPGTEHWRADCLPGEHRISAKRPGHFSIEQTVKVKEGQSLRIALVWQPLPPVATTDGGKAVQMTPDPQGGKKDDSSDSPTTGTQEEQEETAPASQSQKVEKLPVPPLVTQEDTVRLVDEAYKIDEAKTPDEKVSLGKQLASLAGTSKKPEERFVLLRRSAELAKDAGHLPMMCQMIEAIGAEFDIDTLLVQTKMFDKYAVAATGPTAIATGLDGAKELTKRAMAEDRYDMAIRVIESAIRLCERSPKPADCEEWEQKRVEIERLEDQWRSVYVAQETLKTTPDDSEANFVIGRWICFQKGDAKQGLTYLAKGSDLSFKQLARKELATKADDIESLTKVANAWWDLAQTQTSDDKEQLARHAGQLYKIVHPELSDGLTKALVERRLTDIASPKRATTGAASEETGGTTGDAATSAEVLPHGRWVDLLPLIDLKRDTVSGLWERKGDSIVTKRPQKNSTMLLPVTAKGDYRLETQFTRFAGQDAVVLIVPVGSNVCLLTFSESSGKTSRLGVDVKAGRPQPGHQIRVEPGVLANNKKHAVSVLVRLRGDAATIQVTLDGEPYFNWSGDQKAVSVDGWSKLPAKQFALGTNEAVAFHSVRLRPISGKATSTVPSEKMSQARGANHASSGSM